VVLPLFALANAGVAFSGSVFEALSSPVSLGIIAGLVLGKSLGLTLFSWLAIKVGLGVMPSRVTWPQLFSATWLAGIGFTMSLFITNSAFDSPSLLATAKISILLASLLSATIGVALLALTTSQRTSVTRLSTAVAAE
jgi:NhaA family Na+:H+ antiporter